jgi:hypothetical protein
MYSILVISCTFELVPKKKNNLFTVLVIDEVFFDNFVLIIYLLVVCKKNNNSFILVYFNYLFISWIQKNNNSFLNTTSIRSTRTEEAHHQTLPKASPNSETPPSKRQRKACKACSWVKQYIILNTSRKHVNYEEDKNKVPMNKPYKPFADVY